jgi:anti-sigma B factor antagonist
MPQHFPMPRSPSAANGMLVDIDTNMSPPHRRLRVHGELDLATASLLASTLDQQAVGCEQLELDLSGLAFCDLIGLTTLEQAQRRLRDRGCRMSVHGIHGPLQRLLEVEGLRTTLSMSSTTSSTTRPTAILTAPRRAMARLLVGLVRRH